MNPDTARTFKVGDFVIFNDEAKSPDVGYLRSYECAQIVGPGDEGDVVPSGNFQFQRKPEADPRPERASFETRRCPHAAGIRFFKLDSKTFTFSVKKGFFRTPGLPAQDRDQDPLRLRGRGGRGRGEQLRVRAVHDVPA